MAVGYPLLHRELDTGIRVTANRRFIQRLIGLLGHRELSADQGMWIEPCDRVHTFGMRVTIDVIMLESSGKVISLASNVRPWRLGPKGQRGGIAVELAAGSIEHYGFVTGDRLTLGDP